MVISGLVKEVGKLIVGTGVLTVVSNVIKTTTPATVSKIERVLIGVGTYAISSVITETVTTHVEKEINSITAEVKDLVKTKEKIE